MVKKHPSMGESTPDFTILELLVDPLLAQQFQLGHAANKYLAEDSTIGDAEAARIVQGLDQHWPYYHEPVRVSGMMVYVDPTLNRLRQVSVRDKQLISKGWTQENVIHLKNGQIMRPHQTPDDPPGLTMGEIDHTIRQVALVFEEEREGGDNGVYYARTDEIALEFGGMSAVHLSNTLHYHHPEEMRMIDALLEGAVSAEERLARMKALDLSISPDEITTEEFPRQLAAYLEMRLEADSRVPYRCVIRGDMDIVTGEDEDDREPLIRDDLLICLLSIDGLMAHVRQAAQSEEGEPDSALLPVEIGVLAYLHGDTDSEPLPVEIPLSAIAECRSLRTDYYYRVAPKLAKRYGLAALRLEAEHE